MNGGGGDGGCGGGPLVSLGLCMDRVRREKRKRGVRIGCWEGGLLLVGTHSSDVNK